MNSLCYSIDLVNSLNVFTSLFLIFYSPHVNQIKMVYLETGLPKQPWKASSDCIWKVFPLSLANSSTPLVSHLFNTRQWWHISIYLGQKTEFCKSAWMLPAVCWVPKGKRQKIFSQEHIIVGNFLLTSFSLNSRSPEFLKYKHSPQSTSLLLYSPIVWLLFIWRSHDWVRRDGSGVKSPEHSGGGPEFSSQLSYWAAFNRLWLQLQGPPVLLTS